MGSRESRESNVKSFRIPVGIGKILFESTCLITRGNDRYKHRDEIIFPPRMTIVCQRKREEERRGEIKAEDAISLGKLEELIYLHKVAP